MSLISGEQEELMMERALAESMEGVDQDAQEDDDDE